ncbi:hypothetical protein [Marinactinospora rubrisoli]|uniref:Secreted protein n=1 Tax=Marinactinospora rubrisoli TaxID=2715399 RepID=A0ABW2KG83_9ACTN
MKRARRALAMAAVTAAVALAPVANAAPAQAADCPTINAMPPSVSGTVVTARAYWECYGLPSEIAHITVSLQQDTFWNWRTVSTTEHRRQGPSVTGQFNAPAHDCRGGGSQTYRTWTIATMGGDFSLAYVSDPVTVNCG